MSEALDLDKIKGRSIQQMSDALDLDKIMGRSIQQMSRGS
jgi:ABC-type cobalamin transport system ATPase subunit